MFNVTVVNKKDILKYLVSITITLCLVMSLTRYFSNLEQNEKYQESLNKKIAEILQTSMLVCLDETIPGIKETNRELNYTDEEVINKNDILGNLLKIELAMFKQEQKTANIQNASTNQIELSEPESNNEKENNEEVQKAEVVEASTEVTTEIVTQNPLADTYHSEYQGVKIRNETNFEISSEMLSQQVQVNKENIVIFHTHTCESYTSSEKYYYEPTGNYRTTDNNFSVVRVGTELTKYLQE